VALSRVSGDELEGCHVAGTDDGEVAPVERGDGGDAEPLGDGDNARVD
jgi:hypothetical protein